MAFEFKLPDVGEGLHEGRLVEWLVKAGDPIAVDQPFARVETDKAIVELPSPVSGSVQTLHFKAGDVIAVGQTMITFGDGGATAAALTAPVSGKSAVDAGKSPAAGMVAAVSSPGSAPPVMAAFPGRAVATPHTRSLARKLGVDLARVTPSGKGGRITDEDVISASAPSNQASAPPQPPPAPAAIPAASARPASPPSPAPVVVSDGAGQEIEEVPLTHLRKVIAQAMIQSKHTSAHVTHVDEADVTELVAWYKKAKQRIEADGRTKFTILPIFMKAAVTALKAHPFLNAVFDEPNGKILLKKFYHIGIAVDTPEGLMVPVVKHVDRKDMVALAGELVDLAGRARERRVTLDELRGGTFTITNVGAIGGVFATPVIHQPEVAILGMHAIKDRPAVVDGQIVIRKMMYISLSFDHRIVDGLEAARFMTDFVELIQNPDLLMMRLL